MPPNTEGVNQKFQLSAAGTPRYMAPEVARGEMYNMKVSKRSIFPSHGAADKG